MARNYGSPSIKVLWTGKLPKGVSYPSLLWWTLKTALHYFNWGASQKNYPQLRWWVVTVPKGIWTLCFWNILIWLQLLSLFFTPAPGSVIFTIISISYPPELLELHYVSHNSRQSHWFYLPACPRAILARGRLAVNKVHFPLPVFGVQQAASHSGQVLLTPKSCQQNH